MPSALYKRIVVLYKADVATLAQKSVWKIIRHMKGLIL